MIHDKCDNCGGSGFDPETLDGRCDRCDATAMRIQSAVAAWHRETFSGRRPLATAKKVLEEASELHCAAKSLPGPDLPVAFSVVYEATAEECADVAIAVYALAEQLGVDLDRRIRAKLAVLAERPDQQARDRERGIE